MVFVARKIGNENDATLGSRLRALRRTQAIGLDKLASMTRIQKKYLEALEWGWYEELPEPMYVRNFIRTYVRALAGPEQYFLSMYDEEAKTADLLSPHRLPRLRLTWLRFFVSSRAVALAALVCTLAAVGGYVWWQLSALLAPPVLSIISPTPDELSPNPSVMVVGRVSALDSTVQVDGLLTVVDGDGNFAVLVPLLKGVNTISIVAKRRYSSLSTATRTVVYAPVAQ